MSDLEEGEIEGEVMATEAAPAEAPEQSHEEYDEPRERVLATKPCGRAPYFSDPDSNGWQGRGGGGKKKKKKKSGAGAPGFVDIYGQGARAEVQVQREAGPIRLSDVQNLLLWVLAEGTNPRWCFIKNKPLVKRVLLLVVHGLDSATWAEHSGALLPTWSTCLGQPVELQARNATLAPASTVHSLLTVPQTKKRRREDGQGAAGDEQAVPPPPPPPPPPAEQNGHAADVAAAEPAIADLNGATAGAAEVEEAAGEGAHRKRMRLALTDDVSSRVQPQLAAPAAAASPEAAADTNNAAAAATLALQEPHGGAADQPAAATPAAAAAAAPPHSGGSGAAGAAASGTPGRRWRTCTLPPSHYVMTLDQLQEHHYPLPQYEGDTGELVCPQGFVATQACTGSTPTHELVALDCEMCITDFGFELTRATLIDRQGQVLMDELVVPHNPITDHNTRYSGITAEMLEGVTTRLEDVQRRLRELVSAETLVVAHSGDNDLQALKLIHANVIDTSILFPHPRGPPFKSALRVLASRHLMRTIQTSEHNPVEDARAALDLALLKFERGPAYGAAGGDRGDRLLEVLGEADRRSAMVDRLELLGRHVTGNCSAVVAEGDVASVQQLCKEVARPQVDFVWGQLTGLQQFYEDRLAAARASGEAEPSAAYRASVQPDGSQQPQQAQQARQEQTGSEACAPPSQEQPAQGQQAGEAIGNGQATREADGQSQPAEALQNCKEEGQQQLQQQQADWGARQAAALAALDASLRRLWDAAPAGTLVLAVTGQGDTSYSRYLQEQKWRRQQRLEGMPPWNPDCEAHLAAVQDRALSALCFAAVKPPAGARAVQPGGVEGQPEST